jgi:hypothetical protein
MNLRSCILEPEQQGSLMCKYIVHICLNALKYYIYIFPMYIYIGNGEYCHSKSKPLKTKFKVALTPPPPKKKQNNSRRVSDAQPRLFHPCRLAGKCKILCYLESFSKWKGTVAPSPDPQRT